MSANLELLAADLVELTLSARDGLPKALNGRPIAPSNEHAVRIRKEMQQVQSKEYLRIATVLHTDLTDGVPLEIVRRPLRRLDAALALRARNVPTLHQLRSLSIAEQRTDGALDLAQLRLPDGENDRDFLEGLVLRCAQQKQSIELLMHAAEMQLVRLRGLATTEPTAPSLPRAREPQLAGNAV